MATPNSRLSRNNETREAMPVRTKTWQPVNDSGVFPELQDNPNWVFRWTNTSVQKETDLVDRAYVRKIREGWSLVKPSEINLSKDNQRFVKDDVIQRPGQVLMKMPRDMAEQRNAYYMAEDRKKRNVSLRDLATKGATDEQATGFTNVNEGVARISYVGEQTVNI